MGVTASKAIALPPETPKAIVDVWVAASKKIMEDKGFMKKAGKIQGAYAKVYGEDATAVIRAAIGISPEVRAYMQRFLKEKFDVNI